MNTTARKWLSMDLDMKLQWLEYSAWESQKLWKKIKKNRAQAGERSIERIPNGIIANNGGTNNMDRFKMVDSEPVECECEYCGETMVEGDEVVKTNAGIFCGFACYGRQIAENEGDRKVILTADMVG